MAISIDYLTRVISISRNDLALIQSSPVEIRELNLNNFRLELKDWEDSAEGMTMPTTHNHVSPISVGGVTLARVVELINGYTVTFEDGQYAVNLVGANSNVGDNVNVNQVSVRSANSAGLLQTREIEYSSFAGGVWVDTSGSVTGTAYPAGTRQAPVNNLTDAYLIATLRGFSDFFIIGNVTIGTEGNFSGMAFRGESKNRTSITILPAASVENCEFYDAHILGTLDGDCVLRECLLTSITYVNGFVERCVLEPGTITLGGTDEAHFLDCYSGSASATAFPTIDCGGAGGPPLVVRNFSGNLQLVNKPNAQDASIYLTSGNVGLDATVTGGSIAVGGVGTLVDNSTATVDSTNLVSGTFTQQQKQELAEMLLDLADAVEPGLTVRGSLRLALAALAGKVSGAEGTNVTFRNTADNKDRIIATVDPDGNRTAVTLDTST